MQFSAVLCGPRWSHISSVLQGTEPVLVTAFYGRSILEKIANIEPKGVKLLVRLPSPSGPIPTRLPNDPRILLELTKKVSDIQLFVHPRIHAKVFVSKERALIGSANLSASGFSGDYEASLISSNPATVAELRTKAHNFLSAAQPASLAYLQRLIGAIDAGLSTIDPTPDAAGLAAASFASQAGNPPFESFLAWLAAQKSSVAVEVYARSSGAKHNVSGHAYSAYHGLSVIFRGDPTWARSLAGKDWDDKRVQAGLDRIRTFVTANPGLIKNKHRGVWETSYLPSSLGGPIGRSGGAGIGLIKRMMVVLPQYLKAVKLV